MKKRIVKFTMGCNVNLQWFYSDFTMRNFAKKMLPAEMSSRSKQICDIYIFTPIYGCIHRCIYGYIWLHIWLHIWLYRGR